MHLSIIILLDRGLAYLLKLHVGIAHIYIYIYIQDLAFVLSSPSPAHSSHVPSCGGGNAWNLMIGFVSLARHCSMLLFFIFLGHYVTGSSNQPAL